jgi:hypothetical protein
MSPVRQPSRQELEEHWQERVYLARQKYQRSLEPAAREEYMRAIKVFNNMILHRKMPEDQTE